VFHPTAEDLRHLYEIREALEVLAIEKAIENLSQDQLAKLQQIIDEMRATPDDQQWLRLNNEFHQGLYAAARRPRLDTMITNLRDSASSYIHMLIAHMPNRSRPDDEHQEILDACRDGDSERAKKAVRSHMRNTVDLVMTLLKE
jgi:DNA-binding GntR family transcriptional regulator